MLLTPRELAAAARRQKDFDEWMLELSGFTTGHIPRFLRPEQIERIRRAAGLSVGTSLSERGRRYIELMETLSQRLAAIDRALERAMKRSRQRLQETQAVLEEIRARASVTEDGRRVYRTEDRRRAFTDDGTELTREEIPKSGGAMARRAGNSVRRRGRPCARRSRRMRLSKPIRPGRIITATARRAATRSPKTISRTWKPISTPCRRNSTQNLRARRTKGGQGMRPALSPPSTPPSPTPRLGGQVAGRGLAGGAFTFSASDLDDIAQTERATQSLRADFPSP